VHNEDYAKGLGVNFDGDGTHFISSSESPSIDAQTYGTTFTTRKFVEDIIGSVFEGKMLYYQPHTFWSGHDGVVVRV
jgi:hypothetical protein